MVRLLHVQNAKIKPFYYDAFKTVSLATAIDFVNTLQHIPINLSFTLATFKTQTENYFLFAVGGPFHISK